MKSTIKNAIALFKKMLFVLNREQKIKSVVVFVATMIGSIFEMVGISMIIPLVTVILYPDKAKSYAIVGRFCEIFNIESDIQLSQFIAIATIIVYLTKNLYMIFLAYLRSSFSCEVQMELSARMMRIFIRKDYTYFLNTNSSELQRAVSGDVARVHSLLEKIMKLFSEFMTLIAISIFLMVTDWQMALFVIMISFICLLVVFIVFRRRVKVLGKIRIDNETKLIQDAFQVFEGIKEIKVMNRSEYFADKYEEGWKNQRKSIVGEAIALESPSYMIEGICLSAFIVFVCIRLNMGINIDEFFAQIAAFALAAIRILPAVSRITSTINVLNFYTVGLDSVYKYMKEDVAEGNRITVSYIDDAPKRLEQQIMLDGICWKYAGAKEEVLNNLQICIDKGEAVGLIGASGAGKSTLIDIIMGLLKPQRGNVLVDGIDIKELGPKWSAMIGYVPQSIYLIDDSVRRNIAFGIKDEQIDDNKIWKALEMAQLKEFIETLPQGLDTQVGERGIRFSGGQRQRIAIARALYNDPDVLILDEATAALDNETEKALMESIDYLMGTKTIIIVAHRLTTIANCNKVYKIADGQAILC